MQIIPVLLGVSIVVFFMVRAIPGDPAMFIYLDSNSNINDRPNENFAREVMELFTMGVGNYSEKDVREGARAKFSFAAPFTLY